MLAGKTVLERTLEAVRASGLAFHVEDAGHEGMGDSIAAGVKATSDASGWLILPGDLPLVKPESLLQVARALGRHAVALPHYQGQRGHPVGFAAVCGLQLLNLEGNEGAARVVRSFVAGNSVAKIDLDDAGIVTDIDTVDDLARALRLLDHGAGDSRA